MTYSDVVKLEKANRKLAEAYKTIVSIMEKDKEFAEMNQATKPKFLIKEANEWLNAVPFINQINL
ncbi:MAG: hypothetical protein KBC56_04825 [Flavobacterium sp.]|nr:hypothetical protein [Flavobacterium sp.]